MKAWLNWYWNRLQSRVCFWRPSIRYGSQMKRRFAIYGRAMEKMPNQRPVWR